jgi:hypothetical protein
MAGGSPADRALRAARSTISRGGFPAIVNSSLDFQPGRAAKPPGLARRIHARMNDAKCLIFTLVTAVSLAGCLPMGGEPTNTPGSGVSGAASANSSPRISPETAERVGQMIWRNESAGTIDGLTAWNKGEEFASLGIGHFIWYPAGEEKVFTESFPQLIQFLMQRGVAVPDWLRSLPPNPWRTREQFYADFDSPRMTELRRFLAGTVADQARFVAQRLEQALPRMLRAAPPAQREAVARRFYALTQDPKGLYAMIDYVNFKGEGINPKERYKGQGWGLLQVLMSMEDPPTPGHFADAAARVLRQRIANSPPERGERRWMRGWMNRTDTYR